MWGKILGRCAWTAYLFKSNQMKYWTSTSVINKYSERSQRGIDKYGTTMDRKDLSTLDWLRHAQEEAMDLSLYLEKLIVKEETKQQEQ
jgi:hypothetical protein